ncbi:hypothetical protein B0H21DRAFT_190085 [Amylocystis lapponica]|nr:hypothetical protein B0H21DRAFT_190085 [Amylocystis lapponica]
MSLPAKRSFSLPLNHPSSKKPRSSLDVQTPPPKWKTYLSPTPEPSNISKPPSQGTERVSCHEIDLADTKAVNDFLVHHTRRLAREGKRLVHAPRFLDDGINFDWMLDYSAVPENVKDLFNVYVCWFPEVSVVEMCVGNASTKVYY